MNDLWNNELVGLVQMTLCLADNHPSPFAPMARIVSANLLAKKSKLTISELRLLGLTRRAKVANIASG